MANPSDLQGLLDVSKIKPGDYAKLPGALAGFKASELTDDVPLFSAPPEIADVMPLTKAQRVDGCLFDCFTSLLNGLSSGVAQVMGMFRAVDRNDVIVRLYLPKRPQPGEKPQPLYFRVQRGHAELAIQKKWVGPGAPTWLALYAAVYYAYIEDRDAFYKRPELGKAQNAAWLVLCGKDSSRADYSELEDKRASRGRGGQAAEKSSLRADDGWRQVLCLNDPAKDGAFCAATIFGEDKGGGPLTKEWLAWVAKARPTPQGWLRAGLTPATVDKLSEIRKWLEQRNGLAEELRWRLLLFLEANELASSDGSERYAREARAVWEEINKALLERSPVALQLRRDDKSLRAFADKDGVLEVVDTQSLELPNQKSVRALRYLLVRTARDSARGGRKFRFQLVGGVQSLRAEPTKKAVHWLELDQVMTRCQRILGGAAAIAALAESRTQTSFTIKVDGPRSVKFT